MFLNINFLFFVIFFNDKTYICLKNEIKFNEIKNKTKKEKEEINEEFNNLIISNNNNNISLNKRLKPLFLYLYY